MKKEVRISEHLFQGQIKMFARGFSSSKCILDTKTYVTIYVTYVTVYTEYVIFFFLSCCSTLCDELSKDEEASLCICDFQGTGEDGLSIKLWRVWLGTVSTCALASAICSQESTVSVALLNPRLRNICRQGCVTLEVGAGLLLCNCWKQRCSQGLWNMLTILTTHANMIRCLVAVTWFGQWLLSVGESNLKNGFHSIWKSMLLP